VSQVSEVVNTALFIRQKVSELLKLMLKRIDP